MNPSQVKAVLEGQGVQASPVHNEAAASISTSFLETTAERFSKLPLEAEPSGFQAEQRRHAL
jgi:hypothetical protein